ncbi:MAG: DEAD/DEAH box helicase [Spirochaetales bacterium]|nr:DEAD/DEAH box helicase [Spirochaetales bacterium]
MTLSLSLSDLAHRYPTDICNRGIELYNDGRVGDLYFDEGMIESEVEGDRDSYFVKISLNNRGVPVDSDCSCSYCFEAGHCSHIVALLVKLINEKVQLVALSGKAGGANLIREPDFDDFPVSPEEKGFSEESLIPLVPPEELPRLSPFPSQVSRDKSPAATRWKGVLNLRRRGTQWRITAALLYIKKDGTPGRLDRNFSLARVTEALNDVEERFYRFWKLLPLGGEEGMAFEKVASSVLADRDKLTLVNDRGETYRSGTLDRLGLSFSPVDFPRNGLDTKAIRFTAEFILPLPGGPAYYTPAEVLHRDGGRLFFASLEEPCLYDYEIGDKAPLVDYLLARKELPWSLGEIKSLEQEFAPFFDEKLSWNFTQKSIRACKVTPHTVLTAYDPGYGGSAFKLSFEYGPMGSFPYGRDRGATLPFYHRREEDSRESLSLFLRDGEREKEIFRWLENWFLTHFGALSYGSPLNQRRAAGDFVVEKPLDQLLYDRGDELLDRGIELRLEKQKGRVRHSTGSQWQFTGTSYKEWLSLSLTEAGKGEVDLEEFLSGGLLRSGSDLIVISPADREKLQTILERGDLKEGKLILSPHDFETLDLMEDSFKLREDEEIARIKERASRLKNFDRLEESALPKKFEGELRPYQKGGYDWLHFLHRYGLGGCLADDMGLGKTVQTLCFLQSLKERKNLGQVLLLAPVTTLSNWQREAEKFTPGLSVVNHSGPSRGKSRKDLAKAGLILASYQTFLRDADWMAGKPWTFLILDEAQAVKNWQSRTRQAVKTIEAEHRLALTGTPVENSMTELWSLFDLLEPGLLGSRDMFRRRYQIPMERDGDKSRTEELKKRVAPLMLRRKKEEVLDDLPEKEETLVWLEMGEEQRKVYDEARKGFLALIEQTLKDKEVSQAAMEILTALLRLRQLAVIPSLADVRYGDVPSCKMAFLDYFLDDLAAEDHRVLIFSQFVSALQVLRGELDRRGTEYAYLDGQTKDREKVIEGFQEEGGPPVFLISLKAGGVGINLTAADYVVLLDPWWNPAVENQAVDRAHRMGQTRSVMVYKPVVRDTVEEKILELQKGKKDLAADLISEDKGFLKSLSREEVTGLFR